MPGKLVDDLARSRRSASPCPGVRHVARGFSTRNVSVSFRPIGSSPSSSEPARATMRVDLGHLARIALLRSRRSMSARLPSSLIDGSFSSCMIMSPSSIVGMKVLPMQQDSADRGQRQRRAAPREHAAARVRQRPVEQRRVAAPRAMRTSQGSSCARPAQQEGGEHRDHGERQQQRARPARTRWSARPARTACPRGPAASAAAGTR